MRLVEARLGVREGVAAVCAELVPRVAGNPFFLLEMVDALLERGTLEIVERPDGGATSSSATSAAIDAARRCRRRSSSSSAIASASCPRRSTTSSTGSPSRAGRCSRRIILTSPASESDEAITRLCARGLVRSQAGGRRLPPPARARRRLPRARSDGARAAPPACSASTSRRRPSRTGSSAAIVARHLARGESATPAAELYLEAASAARNGQPGAARAAVLPRALSLVPRATPPPLRARGARGHLPTPRPTQASGAATCPRSAASRAERSRIRGRAGARPHGAARLDEGYFARGLPIAQRAAEIARLAKQPPLEVEALHGAVRDPARPGRHRRARSTRASARSRSPRAGGLPPRLHAPRCCARRACCSATSGASSEAVEAYADAIAVFGKVGARRSEARAPRTRWPSRCSCWSASRTRSRSASSR
jgi:hypothetical protein